MIPVNSSNLTVIRQLRLRAHIQRFLHPIQPQQTLHGYTEKSTSHIEDTDQHSPNLKAPYCAPSTHVGLKTLKNPRITFFLPSNSTCGPILCAMLSHFFHATDAGCLDRYPGRNTELSSSGVSLFRSNSRFTAMVSTSQRGKHCNTYPSLSRHKCRAPAVSGTEALLQPIVREGERKQDGSAHILEDRPSSSEYTTWSEYNIRTPRNPAVGETKLRRHASLQGPLATQHVCLPSDASRSRLAISPL